ncbi:hypothetical protein X743_31165 [Mesorhizobium sp. LNHC252B00]|nr:hypothetical protein X743_31165 [Mesorhizobium sp. LNHC252B00]
MAGMAREIIDADDEMTSTVAVLKMHDDWDRNSAIASMSFLISPVLGGVSRKFHGLSLSAPKQTKSANKVEPTGEMAGYAMRPQCHGKCRRS